MKVFLAGVFEKNVNWAENTYSLLSFFYYKPSMKTYLHTTKELIIDSGTFTFMNKYKRGGGDFDSFVLSLTHN